MLKKTFRKKLNKSVYQKENLKELKLCDEIELREFKAKLKLCKELSKEKSILNFLILLKSLNGVNPLINYSQCYIKETTKIIALKTIKKIMTLFTQMNIFFFYFKYYHIDEKIIQKLIPNLKYTFYPKDSKIFKEGDFSTQFYFLLKGKISFKKKIISSSPRPKYIERFTLGDNTHFGEWDIVYERKKKTTAFCEEDCHIISIDRDIFKDYLEQRVNKVESEFKILIKKTLMKYMIIPETKIDRLIQNDIQTLFFRRGEIIYREGDINTYLFLINSGEANLFQNFEKCEYSFMQNNQYSMELIKNMAKRIDYKGIMNEAYDKYHHLNSNNNINNHNEKNNIDISYEDSININLTSEKLETSDNNIKSNSINNNINNNMNSNKKEQNKEEIPDKNTLDTLKLDLLLEKKNMKNILSLNKGSLSGLEICTGITKFKYSLISNSDFTSVFKIDLKKIEGEHLTELMINLLPLFIEYERKIHYQIKKLKFIDSNLLPESCQKYSKKNAKENYFFKDEENDDKYKKRIHKIDKMFDTNEGGFIKMNIYNMNLQKKKNELKDLIKENSRKDKKAYTYLNSFINEQNSKFKFRGVKKITPIIPNIEIFDKKFENRYKLVKNQQDFEKENEKNSDIYQTTVNNKNLYFLIDNNVLSGKKRKIKAKSFHKDFFFTKKTQEMFNNLYTKGDMSKFKPPPSKKRVISTQMRTIKKNNMSIKKLFIENNNYMRDLVVKKNKTNVHCFETDTFVTKNKRLIKKLKESNSVTEYLKTYGNMMDIKKITFFNTGKYDIPLLTENK